MSKQLIFDKIVTHLLTQKEKSLNKSGKTCAYRGVNDKGEKLMCAVGCLIEDEHFDDRFNLLAVKDQNVSDALAKSGVDTSPTTLTMLSQLQYMHDHSRVKDWPEELKKLAKLKKLKYNYE